MRGAGTFTSSLRGHSPLGPLAAAAVVVLRLLTVSVSISVPIPISVSATASVPVSVSATMSGRAGRARERARARASRIRRRGGRPSLITIPAARGGGTTTSSGGGGGGGGPGTSALIPVARFGSLNVSGRPRALIHLAPHRVPVGRRPALTAAATTSVTRAVSCAVVASRASHCRLRVRSTDTSSSFAVSSACRGGSAAAATAPASVTEALSRYHPAHGGEAQRALELRE